MITLSEIIEYEKKLTMEGIADNPKIECNIADPRYHVQVSNYLQELQDLKTRMVDDGK